MNPLLNRRQFLSNTGQGLSGIALTSLLAQEEALANENPSGRRLIRPNHLPRGRTFPGKGEKGARDLLFRRIRSLDTFDYKQNS